MNNKARGLVNQGLLYFDDHYEKSTEYYVQRMKQIYIYIYVKKIRSLPVES